MKYVTAIAFILNCICTLGCGNNNGFSKESETFVDELQEATKLIRLEKENLENYPLCPESCVIIDSFLVVCENSQKITNDFIKIYKDSKLIYKCGIIGNGPDDYLMPRICYFAPKNSFGILDALKYNIATFSPEYNRVSTVFNDIPPELDLTNYLLSYNDTAIIVSRTSEYQLQFYDRKAQKVKNYIYYDKPTHLSNLPDIILTMSYFGGVYAANDDYIAIAYKKHKVIDIIQKSNMKLCNRLFFKNFDANKFHIENDMLKSDYEEISFFYKIFASEDCFYVLYWNDTVEKIGNGSCKTKMYKIDFNGKILSHYTFNIQIGNFQINGDEIVAVGMDPVEKEMLIYKGKL